MRFVGYSKKSSLDLKGGVNFLVFESTYAQSAKGKWKVWETLEGSSNLISHASIVAYICVLL